MAGFGLSGFFCCFDPFGYGHYKYTFTNDCHEESGLQLNDKTAKIFLSTKGKKGPVSDRLIELLGYIEHPENVPEKPLYRNMQMCGFTAAHFYFV